MELSEKWDALLNFVSEETLQVVTAINGYNEESLDDICYAVTGYRSVEQLMSEYY